MALNKSTLGSNLWTKIKSRYSYDPAITPAADAEGLALWTDIAGEIIDHIKNAAVVQPGTFNNPAGQPVNGTQTTAPQAIAGTGTII